MNSRKEKNKKIRKILVLVGVFIISTITLIQANKENINTFIRKGASTKLEEDSEISKFQLLLENLFDNRNKAILTKNDEVLKKLYDIDHKFGLWAYEQEVTKMKYLENWSYKQGVKFNDIKTRVKVRKVKEKEENLYGII
ncbi:MAG: amidase domain-containing protein, partial [Paraclostridium sp.]